MNMISTGAFLNEMDASNKQLTVAEKFAAVWEKKNAKAARAGGVSLMALSLAACGSSSTTTTTTDTTTDDTTTDTTTDTTPVTPAVDAAKSIVMTNDLEAATGGSGDDTITASLVSTVASNATVYTAATTTLNAGDTIDGGAGSDTLTITASGNIDSAANVPGALITNVETINIRAVTSPAAGSDNTTFDAINTTGVTALNAVNSTDSVVFSNVPTAASIGVVGNGAITVADVAFTYATASTAPVINISGGTKADTGTDITNSGSGALSATITSTGAANAVDVITLAGGATVEKVTINAATDLTIGAADATVGIANGALATDATITVTGAGKVDLNTLGAAVKTVDATGNTGGTTAILAAAADVFTGGSGDDFVTLAGGVQTGAVSGGDGTDTLEIGDSDVYDVASEVTKISGFETLRIKDIGNNAEDYQVNLISGITKIEVGAGNNAGDDNILNKLNATQAANVHVIGDQAGDLDLVLTTATGTSDVATVTLGSGLKATEAYDIAGDLNVTGFETLNLVSNPGVSVTAAADKVASIGTLTSTTVTAVNMTGASITLSNGALTKAATYDGSALTGVLNVAGTLVAGSTVKGSAGKDVFTIGGAGSTYIGNAADDTFNVAAVGSLENSGTFTTITGGAGTKDELDMTANAAHTIVDSNFKNVTGLELFTADTSAGTNNFTMNVGGYFATAFADGVTVDIDLGDHGSAAVFNASTYDKDVTLTLDSAVVDTDITVTTGGGNDTVTITGSATDTVLVSVSTGAGNDKITVTMHDDASLDLSSDVMSITAGTGQDTIDVSGVRAAESLYVDINIGAGDSTLAAYDIINNYQDNGTTAGNLLDFAGSADHATAVTNNAVTGYTTAELLVTSSATGLVTFSGTKASSLTAAEKAAAVQIVFTAANDTVVFTHGDDSWVFNNNASGDSLVQITSYLAVGVDTTATTDQQIYIA